MSNSAETPLASLLREDIPFILAFLYCVMVCISSEPTEEKLLLAFRERHAEGLELRAMVENAEPNRPLSPHNLAASLSCGG